MQEPKIAQGRGSVSKFQQIEHSYTCHYLELEVFLPMFFIQNPPPENPDPIFCVNYGVGSPIDFCIWVLEQDGLRVPPFDQHPAGDGSLQANGLTPEEWRSWLTKTALLRDQRLHWQLPDIEVEKQQMVAEFSQMQAQFIQDYPDIDFPSLDSPAFLDQIDRHNTWQQEQSEKIRAAVDALYGEQTPPDMWGQDDIAVWDGATAIADRLRELREVYPSRQREQPWLTFPTDSTTDEIGGIPDMTVNTDDISEWLRPYYETLGYLEVHFVAYPYPVALAIPPNAIVLSPSANPQDSEVLKARLLEAVEQLL